MSRIRSATFAMARSAMARSAIRMTNHLMHRSTTNFAKASAFMRIIASAAAFSALALTDADAQASSKVRKPYAEPIVVENNAIVVALPQSLARARNLFDGQPGFYSWRIDANGGPGLSFVLGTETMISASTLEQVVGASTLRKCADPTNRSSRSCTNVLRDSVGTKDNVVQMIVRDRDMVKYFLEEMPPTVRVTTYDAHGRFFIEQFRVRYRALESR